jgi:hypothetical protein
MYDGDNDGDKDDNNGHVHDNDDDDNNDLFFVVSVVSVFVALAESMS